MSREGRHVLRWSAEATVGRVSWLAGGRTPKRKTGRWPPGSSIGNVDAAWQPGEVVAHGRDPWLFQVEKGEERIGSVAWQAGQVAEAHEASDTVVKLSSRGRSKAWPDPGLVEKDRPQRLSRLRGRNTQCLRVPTGTNEAKLLGRSMQVEVNDWAEEHALGSVT